MEVVGGTISWLDSWLDGGLAWLVSPLALESVSLWRFWSSLLSASGCEISGADWLAVGGDPLIAGWKFGLSLEKSNLFELDIISDWPWAIVSTDLSAVSITFLVNLSVSVQAGAFGKFWSSTSQLCIVWSLAIALLLFLIELDEP